MTSAVIFDNVSKRFILRQERPRSFQEAVINIFRRNGSGEEFWALRDVSFAVEKGEMVGIIGPNSAGKSTVLKLISRIIEPTSGRVEVNGRVSALLELGAGFHPDLTGRENVYLNGSILGLSRKEIRRKFDSIVSFAEMERFIDVPVKHYSSGMYVRLGFSVAIHIDPEILLIDEVLAVGDAAFQRKCLERIDKLRQEGITILLVSHNLDVVRSLCKKAIWLDKGKIMAEGNPEAVVRQYMWHSYESSKPIRKVKDARWGTGVVKIEQVRILNDLGIKPAVFATGEPMTVEIHYRASRRVEYPVFGLAIHRSDGVHITGPNTQFAGYEILWIEGRGTVSFHIPRLPLLFRYPCITKRTQKCTTIMTAFTHSE
jgi:lipopolysaccharide transport system ATP-binding protein